MVPVIPDAGLSNTADAALVVPNAALSNSAADADLKSHIQFLRSIKGWELIWMWTII